jgi:hypothetical protein
MVGRIMQRTTLRPVMWNLSIGNRVLEKYFGDPLCQLPRLLTTVVE